MSRRISFIFVIAGCAAFVAPASADRECFEGICKMPEVLEQPVAAPEPPAEPAQDPVIEVVPPQTAERQVTTQAPHHQPPAPDHQMPPQAAERPVSPPSIGPAIAVDAPPRPALEPLARRPIEPKPRIAQPRAAPRPAPASAAHPPVAEQPAEPVGLVGRTASLGATHAAYGDHGASVQPNAGVVLVVPGVQYGDDGVAAVQGRQDSSWQLCQTDGRERCGPYNYQPYGASGYRPLGTYRQQRAAPVYVHVPDARIISVDGRD